MFTLFKRLFPPISQSSKSKLFRFFESLGKSSGKKWFQNLKLLLIKGVILQNKFFIVFFFFICSLCFTVFLPPFSKVQCPDFLDFLNPWGKVKEKVVSDLKTFAHKGCKSEQNLTDRHTCIQTDIATYRLNQLRGPILLVLVINMIPCLYH